MAFQAENLARATPLNTLGPALYVYNTTIDTVAQVSATTYFTPFPPADNQFLYAFQFNVGDLIQCVCKDGGVEIVITAINPVASAPETIDSGAFIAAVTTASATPGTIRASTGRVTESATVMTSGNIVGVRGEADLVGASGGFVYGVQGKVIPTGTLSGSVWAPAVFGQYDLSGATLNAGQIAAVWGDMGATGGTFTDATGARMFAGTNTVTGLTLNSMMYLYGKATYLFELTSSSSTYISAATTGALSGTVQKIAIVIDGVTYYIPCATAVA